MPNMVFAVVGDLMILVHSAKPPTDAEWDEYLDTIRDRDPDKMLSLAITVGGAPKASDRNKLNKWLNGKTTLGAVVSPSPAVRGVVTALSWFNEKIKAFAPDRVADAFQHLGIPKSEHELIWREIRRLCMKLGDEALKEIARQNA